MYAKIHSLIAVNINACIFENVLILPTTISTIKPVAPLIFFHLPLTFEIKSKWHFSHNSSSINNSLSIKLRLPPQHEQFFLANKPTIAPNKIMGGICFDFKRLF